MSDKQVLPRRRHMRSVAVMLAALIMAAPATTDQALALVPQDASVTPQSPRATELMTGRGIAFALTFDQSVSHTGSRLTLVSQSGDRREVQARLMAQPNTLYASVGALQPGRYELQWDALAADGTRRHGTLPFKVGPDNAEHQY